MWRQTVELVRSERSEVEQRQVDALSMLCGDDPRSVVTITGWWKVNDRVA